MLVSINSLKVNKRLVGMVAVLPYWKEVDSK